MDGYIACPTHPLQVYCRDRFDLRYAEAATLAGLVAAARVGVDWLTLEELGVAVAREADISASAVGGHLPVLRRAGLVESRRSGKIGGVQEWRATPKGVRRMRGVGDERSDEQA